MRRYQMKKLNSYLQALQAGKYQEKLIEDTIEQLDICKTQEISENRRLIAAVYCQLLQYCQGIYDMAVPKEYLQRLLNIFESIEQISTEATEEEKEDSNVMIIWFLHELKVGGIQSIDDTILQKSILILLQELGRICFIFEIKDSKTGQYIFSIHDMIVKAISTPEFLDVRTGAGIYQIQILQLAVKLFVNEVDKQKVLDKLKNKCNLKFIEYLERSAYIVDSQDLMNYQKNGVMIFYNNRGNKILVRNRDKKYFFRPSLDVEIKLHEEKDYEGKTIGFFVEYELSSGDSLINYSEMLKDEEGQEKFLSLVFEKKAYNILFENFILKCENGDYKPVNPFCEKDNVIVKGTIKGKSGKIYNNRQFIEAVSVYRNSALKKSSKYTMNRVSFGLVVLLLQQENVGISALRLKEFTEEEWYQSQLLERWVRCCKDPINAVTFIVENWYQENKYCEHIRSKKILEKSSIEQHEIGVSDFYPLKSKLDWIYQILGVNNFSNCNVLCGKFEEGDEEDCIICDKGLCVRVNDIKDPDTVFENLYGDGDEIYFIYNSKENKGVIYEQRLMKNLFCLIKMQEKNQLTLETAKKINVSQYKDIKDRMELHREALQEVGKNIFADFDTQVYYRLVHNLIWSQININNVENYFEIIAHHQILDFKNISNDEKFMRSDSKTLYVPKEGSSSDGALRDIYEHYLKAKSTRELNDLYDSSIVFLDNRYYHNNEEIKRIVFLCDNIESGTATIRMLKAYLSIDISSEKDIEKICIQKAIARCQKYYSSTQDDISEVKISDIVKRNMCEIEVHAYYGTLKGRENIMAFFKKQKIVNASVSYEYEIKRKAVTIVEEAKNIWKKQDIRSNIYSVIREFNMPKYNVFPDAMLKDPKKAICMFVKKEEKIK